MTNYWDAEAYDKWFESKEGRTLFKLEASAVRAVMRNIRPPFLEIGVGTGRFAKELGIEYGIDPSLNMLKTAEMRGIKVKEARGEELPFGNESFGGVFLLFTLCFVGSPETVLSEAVRTLKKDGGLIIGIINRESSWGELYLRKKSEGHPIYGHARFFSVVEVSEMIEKAGMRVEAYSSTLCRPPSGATLNEAVHKEFLEGAGFVCILARKQGTATD